MLLKKFLKQRNNLNIETLDKYRVKTISETYKYLIEANKKYKQHKFKVLKQLPIEIIRKRSSETGWCIEELIRHMIRTEEWWMHSIVLQTPELKFHPCGIANDEQATNWISLNELWNVWESIEQIIYDYLELNPNLSEPIAHSNPEWNKKFSGRWVLYHILQHELETWGMIAERLRQWNQKYWEF